MPFRALHSIMNVRAAFAELEQRFDCHDARRYTQAQFPELLGSL
jgi:hypothetical protein